MSKIYSFSYALGQLHEIEADVLWNEELVVFDCRKLPDPEGLGVGFDGRDRAVQEYVLSTPAGFRMLQEAVEAIGAQHSVAFGCVAGKNRSVTLAEVLASKFDVEPDHLGLKAWEDGSAVAFFSS